MNFENLKNKTTVYSHILKPTTFCCDILPKTRWGGRDAYKLFCLLC